MLRIFCAAGRYFSAAALTAALLASPALAAAKTEPQLSVVYAFNGGADGDQPGSLVADKSGNLYGVTFQGGAGSCPLGCGTVFKISRDGTKTTLHAFQGGTDDGSGPAGIVLDRNGTIYGTAIAGGVNSSGIFFKLTPDGRETILHYFDIAHVASGFRPESAPIFGMDGNLYGMTQYGGSTTCVQGCGTVFRITTHGEFTTIHAFTAMDGWQPYGGFTRDNQGYLYGTTMFGGARNGGVVFRMDMAGNETLLHAFTWGDRDGFLPQAPPILDEEGNLYGGTTYGPARDCEGQGCGIIYKISRDGTETVLHSFRTGPNFGGPGFGVVGKLLRDRKGNLYGTTYEGGASLTCNEPYGCGSVFMLTPAGDWKMLHKFLDSEGGDGGFPVFGLIRSEDHDNSAYYGTTSTGPGCCGMVFKIGR